MNLTFRSGEAYGLSLMKFTLVYDGPLGANGNPRKKQVIREHIHPQLLELWNDHPTLKGLSRFPHFRAHIVGKSEQVLLPDGSFSDEPEIDLCEPVTKKGFEFLPLVRDRLGLKCALKIVFLRKEEPGGIYQRGDIDNRIKTLLDALTAPQHDEQVDHPTIAGPTYCLLEDDSLITGLEIQSQRLLGNQSANILNVRLNIEVDVRVTAPRLHNRMFLGD